MIAESLSEKYFVDRLEEVAVFEEQNNRYQAALIEPAFEADLEPFRDLTLETIATEQSASLSLVAGQDASPYAQLAAEYEQAVNSLRLVHDQLDSLSTEDNENEGRLRYAAQRASELAPQAREEAGRMADARIAEARLSSRQLLEGEIGRLTASLIRLEALYEVAATPWPVPLALQGATRKILTIDEIPVPPETHDLTDEVTRRLVEKHGYTWNASVMLTAHLINNPDVIYTPEELGVTLYTDESHFTGMSEEEKQKCIRVRIHSLLNRNARVIEYVDDEGFRLQYGYRHFLDPNTRQRVRPKRRIYRVVKRQPGQEPPETFEDTQWISQEELQIFEGRPLDRPVPYLPPGVQVKMTPEIEVEDGPNEERIMAIIQLLNGKGLLPESLDAKLMPATFRNRLIQMKIEPNESQEFFRTFRQRAMGAPTTNHINTGAVELVASAVSIELPRRYQKDRSLIRKTIALVEASLVEFFETEARPDSSSE